MLLLSDSISRRYTPPTCTLEINAQTSALSRWARRPMLKQLQFYLSFDNLLGPDDQPVQVSGDRAQLDSLCEAIEAYVQQQLNQLPTGWQTAPPESTAVADPSDVSQPVVSDDKVAQAKAAPATLPEPSEAQGIYLQSWNLLFHDLFLGSLATETSGSVIHLSTSQLFDLASALEEYTAELSALPNLQPQRRSLAWVQGTPIWARSTAIAVLAVGVTTATLELTNNSNPNNQKISEQPATLPLPPVPPPPPPGATPVPPNLPTVTVPSTLPRPSELPNIEPPPKRSTSSEETASESDQETASQSKQPKSTSSKQSESTSEPAETPSTPTRNQIIAVQPRGYPAKSRTMARQASPESETFTTSDNNSIGAISAPTTQSGQLNETAFDTAPQVAEARSYFQERWRPPRELKQSLQYTLILNPDGSIQRPVPRGQVAETFLDRTPIPLANEPFVSPVQGNRNPKIRVVLDPDGSVKTFPESSD